MYDSPQKIYETYKMRSSIEQGFDTLKNFLNQDHSYMRNDESFEGWCFINL
jgi:transposase